jgi:hypothetical protein
MRTLRSSLNLVIGLIAGAITAACSPPFSISVCPDGPLARPPEPIVMSEERAVARRPDQDALQVAGGHEMRGGVALWFTCTAPADHLPAEARLDYFGFPGDSLSGSLDKSRIELVSASGRQVEIRPRKRKVWGATFVHFETPPSSEVVRLNGTAAWNCVAAVRTDEPCPAGKYRVRLLGDWDPKTITWRSESIVVDRDWREIEILPAPEHDTPTAVK